MSITGIVLIVVLPVLLLIGFSIYGIFSYKYITSYRMSHNGLGIYSYDPFTRKAKTIRSGTSIKTLLLNRKKPTKIERIIQELEGEEGVDIEKLFRGALNKIANKDPSVSLKFRGDFKKIKNKTNRFQFSVSFDLLEGTTDYIINIFWKTAWERVEYDSHNNMLLKDELLTEGAAPQSFIAFNLRSSIANPGEQMLKLINASLNKSVNFIVNNQTLIIVINAKTIEKVNKITDRFVSKLKNKGKKMGMLSIFNGSAHVSVTKMETNRDIIKLIRVLDFLIILSIDQSVNFISNRDKTFDIKKYQNFSKGQKMFRDSLKTDSIVSDISGIVKWGKKRKVIDFAYPSIKGMNKLMLNRLLANGNNLDDMIDAHSKSVGIKNAITKPTMIDVNKDWLIRNKSKIVNKKIIYSIRIKNHLDYSEISDVIRELRAKGFIFSLNISLFLASTSILVSKVKPEFIVVSGDVWDDEMISTPALFASLLGLSQIAKEDGIKLIYENPSSIVDDVMAKKLGIEYFYNKKR